jgi:26S proteasome regulatory subunit T6
MLTCVVSTMQVMGKSKVLVKVHPEGKYVVDIDKEIDIAELTPGGRLVGPCCLLCVLLQHY